MSSPRPLLTYGEYMQRVTHDLPPALSPEFFAQTLGRGVAEQTDPRLPTVLNDPREQDTFGRLLVKACEVNPLCGETCPKVYSWLGRLAGKVVGDNPLNLSEAVDKIYNELSPDCPGPQIRPLVGSGFNSVNPWGETIVTPLQLTSCRRSPNSTL